jgi:hypothetical protein
MLRAGSTASDSSRSPDSIAPEPRVHLAVVLEADRPLGGGLRVDIDGVDEVIVGRGARRVCEHRLEQGRNKLLLSIPGASLSAVHARLCREGKPGWVLRDARSTNGTYVNGRGVTVHRLEAGDVLEMGRAFLIFMGGVLSPEGTTQVVDLPAEGRSSGTHTLVPSFAHQLASLPSIAAASLPVLLLGETGTGKEVLARAIHSRSGRAGPLVTVNCAAIPPTLVESHLFGHRRGAFSGAISDEPGLVRSAQGGSLFLDEIGDLPLAAQGALLRVLQEREVLPVGGTRPVAVDVRFIAATHRDLGAMAAAGAFR